MKTFTSKVFGGVTVDDTSDFEFIELKSENKKLKVSISDCSLFGERLELCINLLDKYSEINEKAKNAITKNFPENELIKYYFKAHFDCLEAEILMDVFGAEKFEGFDIEKVVEGLKQEPFLLFGIDKEDKVYLALDYMVSKEYSDEILVVIMDVELNVTGFSHES